MSFLELSRLLPLPEEELRQVLDYASTLSKVDAVAHFQNLLGDSAQCASFVSSFNARRADPTTTNNPLGPIAKDPPTASSSVHSSDMDAMVPGHPHKPRKKNKNKHTLHMPAPRQVASLASLALAPGTSYSKKKQEDDYISARHSSSTLSLKPPTLLAAKPATPTPPPSSAAPQRPIPSSSSRPRPSAGTLVSDLGLPKPKAKTPGSRSSAPLAKVTLSGGVPMHGVSTALADLDLAIRSLEQTTNPTHQSNSPAGVAARRCTCVAAQHPLQSAAPNCLRCGKVICVKEGLGPCTFCGAPLLHAADVQAMVRELVAERGRERMAADREAHGRPGIKHPPPLMLSDSFPPIASASASASARTSAEAMALEHRDKLLGFQAQNAQRTTVRDEAADFDVSAVGNMWASPGERAQELKRQQRLLREMEWNAQPEYEKRRQVVSIDLVGGTVVKKMAVVERPPSLPQDPANTSGGPPETPAHHPTSTHRHSGDGAGAGAFSRNPLLGGMIKPIYKGKEEAALQGRRAKRNRWRRVQDDPDDNQAVILDGDMYGGADIAGAVNNDEPTCR